MKQNAARRLDDMGVEIEQQGSTHKAGTGAPPTGEFGKGAYTSVDYTNDPKEADIGACTNIKTTLDPHSKSCFLNIIPRHQMGTSLNTQTHTTSYAGMDSDNFLDDNDPETFDNIGRSRGVHGGQPGEAREMGGYRATLKSESSNP